jgi:hypothetical protein
MNPSAPSQSAQDAAADRAIAALEGLLSQQRDAMVTGDLQAMQAAQARLHALLSHPAWQKEAARTRSAERLRAGLQAVAVNADLAARGDAHARRGLSALGAGPAVYGAGGNLPAYGGSARSSRGVSA